MPDSSSGAQELQEAIIRAARRFAAIVESSDDAIVSKDLDGVVTSWNPAAVRMFGYSADEMIGQPIRRIIPQDRQAEEDQVLATIRRGDKVDHFETIRQRKDGSLIPISLTVSPIRDESGRVVGASKIARDITERKDADAERVRLLGLAQDHAAAADRLYKQAQEASRLKDEFLATLSHELRTPLNAVLGYARLVRSGLLPIDSRERAIEVIERNATSLTQIVEDVLDVSRIISGKLRLNVQSVDVPEVVHAAIDAVLPAADAKRIRIETVLDPRAAPISGDPERLQQILWNLMINAVKFTPKGGKVQVRLSRVNSHIEIVVADTGIGMSPEFLPFVFDPFRQADSGTTREHGGLGLGLGIARQLVEMHGGTIAAFSEGAGQGATFRVTLPVMIVQPQAEVDAKAPSSMRSTTATKHGQVPADAPDLRGVRVLVVDDESDALAMVRDVLEAGGAEVETAGSGAEALAFLLAHERPHIVLADLGMPKMDGYALIEHIRTLGNPEVREIPAVALTAYARSQDRTRALRAGFQLHLSKPIDPAELLAAIEALTKRRGH